MAFEPKITAALTGVTLGQLSYWRRQAILVPEYSAARPIVYSFRDVIALRTVAYLRQERSLQAIRKALRAMSDLGEADHLSSYRLVAQGKKGIVLVHDDRGMELAEQPGQQVTVVKLGDVVHSFPLKDVEVPNLFQPQPQITIDPEIRSGHPVIRGTRVPFELVASLVCDGIAPEHIATFYPAVTADAAQDAVRFSQHVERFARRRAA